MFLFSELIKSASRSYDVAFHVIGCLTIFSSLCMATVTVSIKRQNKTKSKREPQVVAALTDETVSPIDETHEDLLTKTI